MVEAEEDFDRLLVDDEWSLPAVSMHAVRQAASSAGAGTLLGSSVGTAMGSVMLTRSRNCDAMAAVILS